MKTSKQELSDSQYLRLNNVFQEKHKEDMDEIYKLCSRERRQNKRRSWWSWLKGLIGLK